MCDEDVEGGYEVRHGDRAVVLPLLEGGDVVDKDDEVVLLALEVDLGLVSLSLDHCDGYLRSLGMWCVVCSVLGWVDVGDGRVMSFCVRAFGGGRMNEKDDLGEKERDG